MRKRSSSFAEWKRMARGVRTQLGAIFKKSGDIAADEPLVRALFARMYPWMSAALIERLAANQAALVHGLRAKSPVAIAASYARFWFMTPAMLADVGRGVIVQGHPLRVDVPQEEIIEMLRAAGAI
jgi:hypothetical protein